MPVLERRKGKGVMNNENIRICPVERAGSLDSKIRRWVQNPNKILKHYIKEGMTVLELGCGPGFFTIDIAQMVGNAGQVIAADLQEGMLEKLRNKIKGTKLEDRIILHKCDENKIGISEDVDFVLLFYMVHEVLDKESLFYEIKSILKPHGQVLIVEPPIHVSKKEFENTIKIANDVGLSIVEKPKILFSKTGILKKTDI